MTYTYYERLSGLDATFLEVEDANCHMHIGAVAIFDAAPLTSSSGSLDFERIHTLMEAGMHRIPRYRQKLAWVPFLREAIWVDDARFNLSYHLRHTHLPPPGDDRLLKRLTGRIMSQQLDRGKPLWEMWIVEGLEGERFAIITKVHHCMIDGVGSVELTGSVMRQTPDPDPRLEEPPAPWIPRPVPSTSTLLADEIRRHARSPLALVTRARQALGAPRVAAASAITSLQGVQEALAAGFRRSPPTPLNTEIGPHRRFDWLTMDLGAIKAIKNRFGGTVNDVVLAAVSGGLGRFLDRRGVGSQDLDVRAMIPVNVRDADDRRALGNKVAMLVTDLPVGERDPRRRLERVTERTMELKQSKQALGVRTLEDLSDATFTTFFAWFARLTARMQPYNLVVTNVPGPQFPVYILGARMLACYPLVPLFRQQGLGIALFSYDGTLYWGFNADWDALPDLHDVVLAVEHAFEELMQAADVDTDHVRTMRHAAGGQSLHHDQSS
jgi:diacylglycerol O-acyltransferase